MSEGEREREREGEESFLRPRPISRTTPPYVTSIKTINAAINNATTINGVTSINTASYGFMDDVNDDDAHLWEFLSVRI
jgi:hypothetical protein